MTRRLCVAAGVMTMAIAMPFAQGSPSNASAAISGHVTDATAAPVTNYSVVVFPTDRTKWSETARSLRLVRPAQDGSFEVSSLPPGEYWVAATDPMNGTDASGDWLKPETLQQLSFRATRVTLTERQRVMTVLRLIRR
jgi:transcriptional regulator GlxA family with amidase domain